MPCQRWRYERTVREHIARRRPRKFIWLILRGASVAVGSSSGIPLRVEQAGVPRCVDV